MRAGSEHRSTPPRQGRKDDGALRLVAVVQAELRSGGVIESAVAARLRDQQAFLPAQTSVVFLEPFRVAHSSASTDALRALRLVWPEGRFASQGFISRLGADAAGLFLAKALLRERFRRHGHLVLHARGAQAAWSAARARDIIRRGRVVLDMRGHAPTETVHRLTLQGKIKGVAHEREVYDRVLARDARGVSAADHVLVVTQALQRYVIDELGVEPARVGIVPNCVDAPSFSSSARQRWRRRWLISDGAPVLVYSGRLGPERLPTLVADMFAAVARLRPDSRLVLLTYLGDTSEIDSRLRDAGVDSSCVIKEHLGRQEALEALSACDVGLLFVMDTPHLTTYGEAIKIAEYLSAGLGLLLTPRFANTSFDAERDGYGWVVPFDADSESLASVASRVLDRDEERVRERALAACRESYVLAHYEQVIRTAYGL